MEENRVNQESQVNLSDLKGLTASIILYENGEMTEVDDVLTLFSALIKTGLAWSLQGFYGRTARHLIDIKAISEDGTITYDDLPF